MRVKTLGKTSLSVSTFCFGGNVFGWTVDEATSFKLLDAYFEAGGNFIDTANSYSFWVPGNKGGESETIIGKWMKARGNREKIVLATKVGTDFGDGRKGLGRKNIMNAVEESLRRLQIDRIDLYISHFPDEETPVEETLRAFDELLKQGKIRYCGASNYSGAGLRSALETSRSLGLPAYQSLQPHYNLCERAAFESDLQPVCEAFGLGVTPYYSLASGFLTGKYRSKEDLKKSTRGAGVEKYLDERGFRILKALDEVAAEHNTVPAAIALAWLMHRPVVSSAIASATSVGQLEPLLRAAKIELNADSMEKLDRAST